MYKYHQYKKIVATFYSTTGGHWMLVTFWIGQTLVSHCCCLAHSTDELFAFSSQGTRHEMIQSLVEKPLFKPQDLNFFWHGLLAQITSIIRSLSWFANYETQAIWVNHLSALQNYLASLDAASQSFGGPENRPICWAHASHLWIHVNPKIKETINNHSFNSTNHWSNSMCLVSHRHVCTGRKSCFEIWILDSLDQTRLLFVIRSICCRAFT